MITFDEAYKIAKEKLPDVMDADVVATAKYMVENQLEK